MNHYQISVIIRQKAIQMVLAGLLLAAVSFWGVMLFSPKYQSNFDVLVVQNQEGFIDSYTLAKSTEHFSKLLSESVYTETFLNKVLENDTWLSKTLPIDREDRMKEWGKLVSTSINSELGIIHFKVVSNDKNKLERLSQNITGVLAQNNNLFISENQKIEVRMLNAPIVKTNPSAGNMALLVVASFFIGALLVFAAGFYKAVYKNHA